MVGLGSTLPLVVPIKMSCSAFLRLTHRHTFNARGGGGVYLSSNGYVALPVISIETVKLASSQHRFYFDVHKVCGRGKTALGGR